MNIIAQGQYWHAREMCRTGSSNGLVLYFRTTKHGFIDGQPVGPLIFWSQGQGAVDPELPKPQLDKI